MINIEIGGGKKPRRPNYTQVDVYKVNNATVVAPAWDLPFKDDSVGMIFGRHVFEHLSREDAPRALKEWLRVMAPEGHVEMIMPDLTWCAHQILNPDIQSTRLEHLTNMEHALMSVYGPGVGNMQHLWGYTAKTLNKLFCDCGFEYVHFEDPEKEGDLHIIARHKE